MSSPPPVLTPVRTPARSPGRTEGTVMLAVVALILLVSGIGAVSGLTWALEVVWIFLGVAAALLTHRRFPLTRLLCWLLVGHAAVLAYGGHYTYAATPLGDWLKHSLDLARNPYDRFGHLVQGFVPAVLFREVLLRRTPVRSRSWTFFLLCCMCLALSASFELVEWLSAVLLGSGADDFLATQGDQWDTQWDMFLCLCGSVLAQLLLRRAHDAQLGELPAAALPAR